MAAFQLESYERGNHDQGEKREFQKHCSQRSETWAGVKDIEKKEGQPPRSMSCLSFLYQ